jgi:hypothetical protein
MVLNKNVNNEELNRRKTLYLCQRVHLVNVHSTIIHSNIDGLQMISDV